MRARREAAKRRQAIDQLRIAGNVSFYAAARLAGQADPAEARLSVLTVATELERVAGALRKLAAMPPAQRRPVTAGLVADGMSLSQAGELLGVSKAMVLKDLRAAPGR